MQFKSSFSVFFLLISIFLIPTVSLLSQTPPYHHYDTKSGLASSTVYDIIQDSKGFIWFSTLNGLSKFDGRNFKTFTVKEGLNSNVVTSVLEGDEEELYISTYEKGINVLRNNEIENFFSSVNGKSFVATSLIKYKDRLITYRVSANKISIFPLNPKGDWQPYEQVVNDFHRVNLLPNNIPALLSMDGIYSLSGSIPIKLKIKDLPDSNYYTISNSYSEGFIAGGNGVLYFIKDNEVSRTYNMNLDNENIFTIYVDNSENIWVSVLKKGLFLIPKGNDEMIDISSKLNLINPQITSIMEDKERNIWVSTNGNGVYCFNNLYLRNYTEEDGLNNLIINAITKSNSGELILGTFNGITVLQNDKFYPLKFRNKIITNDIYSVKNFNGDIFVSWSTQELFNNELSYRNLNYKLILAPAFHMLRNGFNILGNWDNSITIKKKSIKRKEDKRSYLFGKMSDSNRILSLYEDSEANLWVGSINGVTRIKDIKETDNGIVFNSIDFPDNPILNNRVNAIYEIDKKIWFAGMKGLAIYDLITGETENLQELGGYDTFNSTSIMADNQNRLWIGNMKGLLLIDNGSVKFFDNLTGLPSNEVLSLFYDDVENKLFIGTSNGLSVMDITLLDSYDPPEPEIRLTELRAGDSVYNMYDNLFLEPEQNNIYLSFVSSNYSSPGTVKYKYKFNNKWEEINHNYLNFNYLKNGRYNVQIAAKVRNGEWSKPLNLIFTIKPGFMETVWFQLIIFSFFLIIILLSVRFKIKHNNKKGKEQLQISERINELKHQALSSMMNPHFIFNALNSVQSLINKYQNEEANEYIAMMAHLIRKNLDTAGNAFILLSEEIERLRLYLEIEKLRFQEKFDYQIIINKAVDAQSIMIPNMIIQPFVENTLWHGIINSGKKGEINVSFYFADTTINSLLTHSLLIEVTDNGIGIDKAKNIKKDDHISKGIYIIEERLRLLSSQLDLPQPVKYEDLSTLSKDLHGTKVVITLPPPLYKYHHQNNISN
jgi:ligand-binding sensor domain-containing protein